MFGLSPLPLVVGFGGFRTRPEVSKKSGGRLAGFEPRQEPERSMKSETSSGICMFHCFSHPSSTFRSARVGGKDNWVAPNRF
jgi:hypothetical protein